MAVVVLGGLTAALPSSARAQNSTLTVTVSGHGRVTSDPQGLECSTTCSAVFAPGTWVTLTAHEVSGLNFVRWGGACAGASERTCMVVLDASKKVKATYAAAKRVAEKELPLAKKQGSLPFTGKPVRPPRGRVLDSVDRVLAHMELANLAFNVPKTIRLGSTAEIQLLISTEQTIRQLRAKITALGAKAGATIRVAPRMEARLTGLGFKILENTPEVQAIGGPGPTEWTWDVEPNVSGTRQLHLTVSALITVDGKETPRTIETFDRVIQIHVTFMDRLSGFAGRNWEWLWTGIVIPLAGFLWRQRKRATRLLHSATGGHSGPRGL